MNYYYGKTIEAAIEDGLKDMGLDKNNAEIVVIDEPAKGVFGLGSKKAKVGIEAKKTDADRATEFLNGLFDLLNVPTTMETKEEDGKIFIDLITTQSSTLIGYRGEMLDAIQTLAGAVANTNNGEYKHVVVNCENYREKREETLKELAVRLANKAIKTRSVVNLEPMNPFERRIIHSALTGMENVKTESQGVEPKRYITIIPDNVRTYNKKGDRYNKDKKSNKSEMIKTTQKTSGFGTFLGNSLKK